MSNPDYMNNEDKTNYFTKTISTIGKPTDSINEKVIKREIDNVLSPSADLAHSNWVQYPSSNNLNVLAVAGAGLGVFKSRQLLSNDEKYD